MDAIQYNRRLAQKFAAEPSAELLSQYAISETMVPIADYESAIALIQDNYPLYTDDSILIVGAYLISTWNTGANKFLEILNEKCEKLPLKEQAIIYYLNACHLRFRDRNYKNNSAYAENLVKSIRTNVPFVRNYFSFAELQTTKEETGRLISIAAQNVQKVYSHKEQQQLSFKQLSTSQFFIKEHILGTHLTRQAYELMFGKIRRHK